MRRIEITEELLRDGTQVYRQGDIVSVDPVKAQQWLDLGWARDPETGETGERKPGAAPITPDSLQQAVE